MSGDLNAAVAEDVKCPACGGGKFIYGRSGVFKVPFVPDTPMLQYARSYHPRQYVCLSCGFMGFRLKDSDLARLQKEELGEQN